MEYTVDQKKVIELHNRNLLVSAAAGSGKTAVLVERIIRMLLRTEAPVDIDRLLVVTFTKAAAAEMRERISAAIENRLELEPENEHLQKQAALLHNAQITTIDSFCQSVLRNNFGQIGLDPGFRVADQNEIRLIREDVLQELLEERFREGNEAFIHFMDSYQGRGKDGRIEQVLLHIYDYALSFPWPQEWLADCIRHYRIGTAQELCREAWFSDMMLFVGQKLTELSDRMDEALKICRMPEGPLPYEKALLEDAEQLERLKDRKDYTELQRGLEELHKGKLSAVKSGSCEEALKVRVSDIRKKVYAELEKIKKQYFSMSLEQICALLHACAPAVEMLVSLVLEMDEKLKARKKELNLVDFSDMEHMALQILITRENGQNIPTQTALDYRACFEEILIDEYQDSNMVQELLLQSISGEDEGRQNRFMVGDVKQSIYRFRLARPEIFLEKYASYQVQESAYQKVDLSKNFRSRKEVLCSINEIFYRIMRPEVGHIQYDETAALYEGAVYPEFSQEQTTELMLLEETENPDDPAPDSALSKKERIESEARMCAGKIREMVGHTWITKRRKNERTGEEELYGAPAGYSDIVILLRSGGEWFDIYKKVFEEEGIPAYVATKTGYFASMEIQTVFNYLKILDNPLQDIPLYGVLVSPFGGFTEEEIVLLRKSKNSYLFEDLKQAAEPEQAEAERTQPGFRRKAQSFLTQYERFRERMLYTPIHDLLRMLIRETGFDEAVEVMSGGSRRKANLEALIDKAVAYEQTSFYGLFHFMRYIDHLRKYEVDYGEADILDENSDLVRIMTIHSSKGLEFPICFVCGTGKQFNTQDEKKNIVTNLDLGIGLDYIDPAERTRTRNLLKNIMLMKEHEENLGEELRVLYVALTRAKEKLIITGFVKKYDAQKAEYEELGQSLPGQPLPLSAIREAKCMLDWILAAVHMGGIPEEVLHITRVDEMAQKAMQIGFEAAEQLRCQRLLQSDAGASELKKNLEKRFSYCYPNQVLRNLYTKTTVSELKIAALMEEEGETQTAAVLFPETQTKDYVPAFRRKAEQGGTDRGTAYHKALELLNLDLPAEEAVLKAYFEQKEHTGAMPEGYLALLRMDRLARFRKSDAARRMAEAEKRGSLYREQPFVLGLSANRLNAEFPETETILIQGIIDVFWEEKDGLVVLDYKTDRVSYAEELVKRYQTQLNYYAEALERLMHRPVKEKLIYSFALGTEIKLP